MAQAHKDIEVHADWHGLRGPFNGHAVSASRKAW